MKKQRFSEYFQNWLYDKNGYYANYKEIGKDGDFYTSVSTSSFFGGTIGKRVVDIIKKGELPKNTTILEIGAHHGYLLADIIQFIYTLRPELLKTLNFAIVEKFDNLKKKQKEYLHNSFGDTIKITHYNDINEVKLNHAFIVANEIFDAFPCELVLTLDEKIKIAQVKNHKIEFEECEDKVILDHCEKYKISKGEIAVGYEEFAKTVCSNIKKFEFVTFDYGDNYPRNDFSTRVYSKHKVFPIFDKELKLNELYEKSDITFDVNFKHLADCFKNQNIKSIEYKTQMLTLVEFGIIDLLEILKKNSDETSYLRESQKAKMLLEPTGMGDRFKTLMVKK